MKPYFLSLQFRDAKLFHASQSAGVVARDTHRMLELLDGVVERKESNHGYRECPLDTLLATGVSNALHVLAGERPVPTVRKTTFGEYTPKRVEAIDALANESFVLITSGISKDENGKVVSVHNSFRGASGESLITHKSSSDSVVPVARSIDLRNRYAHTDRTLVTWDRFLWQHDEKYGETPSLVVQELLRAYGAGSTSEVDMPAAIVHSLGSKELGAILANPENPKLKAHWFSLLMMGKTENVTSLREGHGECESILKYTVSRGFEKVIIRDGLIRVPVDNNDLDMFRRGPGWATILDGGVLQLCEDPVIRRDDDSVPNGFARVHGTAGGSL
jgi:hypothetical protein